MSTTASVDNRASRGSDNISFKKGTQSRKWHGHITSSSDGSSNVPVGLKPQAAQNPAGRHSYVPRDSSSQVKLDKLLAPAKKPLEGPLAMGLSCQSHVNDMSAGVRTIVSVPVNSWMQNDLYPDVPKSAAFQLEGFSTATNAPLAMHMLYESAQSTAKAHKFGDRTGVAIGVNDMLTASALIGVGISFGGVRVTAVGQMVNPNSIGWSSQSQSFGVAAGATGAASYGLLAVGEWMRRPGRFFKKSLGDKLKDGSWKKKGYATKEAYLKNRFGLDLKKLKAKALKGKSNEDKINLALEAVRPSFKRNIELLVKHGYVRLDGKLTDKMVDEVAKKYLKQILPGSQFSSYLKARGEEILIQSLRDKKTQKMAHELGDEKNVQAVQEALSANTPEVDKIVLSKIDQYKSERNKRIAIYVLGTIVMLLMCFFTAGIMAAVLAVGYGITALLELYFSSQKIKELEQEKTAPGKWDKAIPIASSALVIGALAASFVIASVFSFGLLPLVLGVVVAGIWIGMNIYHCHAIDVRRQNFIDEVLKQTDPSSRKRRNLTLDELRYLAEYMSDELLYGYQVWNRLGGKYLSDPEKNDHRAVKKLMGDGITVANVREKIKEAIVKREEELEKIMIARFWGRNQQRTWVPKGMVALVR